MLKHKSPRTHGASPARIMTMISKDTKVLTVINVFTAEALKLEIAQFEPGMYEVVETFGSAAA
jgi:hypothetical protein